MKKIRVHIKSMMDNNPKLTVLLGKTVSAVKTCPRLRLTSKRILRTETGPSRTSATVPSILMHLTLDSGRKLSSGTVTLTQ